MRGNENLVQFVDSVVAGLSEPIDPEFARSFVTDTATDAVAPEFVERLVEDLLKVPVVAWREMFGSLSEYAVGRPRRNDAAILNAQGLRGERHRSSAGRGGDERQVSRASVRGLGARRSSGREWFPRLV